MRIHLRFSDEVEASVVSSALESLHYRQLRFWVAREGEEFFVDATGEGMVDEAELRHQAGVLRQMWRARN